MRKPRDHISIPRELFDKIGHEATDLQMNTSTYVLAVMLQAIRTGKAADLAIKGYDLLPKSMQQKKAVAKRFKWVNVGNTEFSPKSVGDYRLKDDHENIWRLYRIGAANLNHKKNATDGWWLNCGGTLEYIGFMRRNDAQRMAEAFLLRKGFLSA